MIYENQIVAIYPNVVPDSGRPVFTGSGLGPAGLRIQSVAFASLDTLHGGDCEVRIRFLAATDDDSERNLIRQLGIEDAGVTIVSLEPIVIRATLRLRTALLLDNQPGGAETVHRQISAATWTRAVRPTDAWSYQDIDELRERDCAVAAAMLLDDLAGRRTTPFGQRKFELAAELVKASAVEAGFEALASRVPRMRSAALDL